MKGPQLHVRWRQFSVSAKGREAIDAIRTPLFVLLVLNGALTALVVITTIIQQGWPAITVTVGSWIH